MKTKKWALMFLLFTGIILFAAQSALGGCEVSDLDWLISGEKAPGTKLEGPITLFYKPDNGISGPADVYWFMRLRKGSSFYSFAGQDRIEFPVDIASPTGVPFIIEQFFDNVVVPTLYPGCNTPPDTCPDIVLKSADMGVDWEPPGANSGLFFFIANIQVGIHH
jgi:hypothetical protein